MKRIDSRYEKFDCPVIGVIVEFPLNEKRGEIP